jgi:hypothetical protein
MLVYKDADEEDEEMDIDEEESKDGLDQRDDEDLSGDDVDIDYDD